ncbi:MAG: DUF2764 domain-containing protein [Spirochaetia bacterium]|nr:DUF2764 domain-containing protein [Spirochaetia bacterium]
MTESEFLSACETTISEKDFDNLKASLLLPVQGAVVTDPLLKGWYDWENTLRCELVKLRAAKKGTDAEKYISENPGEAGVAEIAREAFNQNSPLESEKVLDRARWEYLDMLEAGHMFDIGRLIIYYLKLQLLNRRAMLNKDRGRQEYEKIYADILAAARKDA